MDADDPAFTATDVAAIIGEPERRVRDLHSRGFASFFGRKHGYAVRYSARDIAGAWVARDLVAMGFAPQPAARIGATVMYANPSADAVLAGSPAEISRLAPPPGSGIKQDRCAWRAPRATSSTIRIPVGRIFRDVTQRATRLGGSDKDV